MRQEWHDLVFLHWPVEPALLQPLLPPRLEVDTHEGRAWLGVVPFGMAGIRLAGLPCLPGASAFLELNVRTYVTLPGQEPGVWFFSLDAAHTLAVLVARALWALPYFRAAMHLGRQDGRVHYRSRRQWPRPGAHFAASWRVGQPLPPARPGELAWFLTERYCLYSWRWGRLYQGPIHHPRWRLYEAEVQDLDNGMLAPLGLPPPAGPPLAYAAARQAVEIWMVRRV
jgi:uncharacterized protein YqjF (DUF2071 family)